MGALWTGIGSGADLLFTPSGIAAVICGLTLGFVAGVIPGLNGANAVACVLPFAPAFGAAYSGILIISVYAGTSFGGSIPAILMNIPGEPGSAVISLDGHPMARAGRPQLAIGISRMASMAGGVIGILLTIAIIQPLSNIAVKFGPAEMSIIVLIAIVACSTLIGGSVIKGLTAGCLGMLISLTGVGPVTIEPRMDFGILALSSGIPLIPAVIGMFAVSQLILLSRQISSQATAGRSLEQDPGSSSPSEGIWRRAQRLVGFGDLGELLEGIRITLSKRSLVLSSSVLGVLLGCIPGMGHSVAGFIAYGNAKSHSKDPASFGRGNPSGIIAPEACDNGVTGGVLVPVLTLGIPGNATTAVLVGALYLNGVQVGPLLLQQHSDLAYAMLLAVLVASILILPLGILLSGPLIRLTRIRLDLLIPVALVLSVFGAFSSDNTMVDIGVMVIFGLLAILLRSCGYPIIPLLLGFVLGPIMEPSFVEALDLGQGHISIFWQSAESKVLLAGLVLLLATAVSRRTGVARRARNAIRLRLREARSHE